jgi:small subunit ribosomal protein S15|tara:strand:+ start:432 stop:689 length:258 start_codon:yes stop_codon:yes gene_type:complete
VSTPETIAAFQKNSNDTGSAPVQIALLTDRINNLTTHFKTHKSDRHSRHGLLKIIRKRQKQLKYLKRTDSEQYYHVIKQLGIRDK